ncbi:MAG: multidrug efflux RND transporter permease subunit [Tepidisphaera sp.]|nr:multidrug efflux RND transporter permease subunit [Tepidisphaera sp.]
MISKFFINRPVFAGVISIILVLLGAVAAGTLPIAQYPELAPPIVHVDALYPGANARTIADTVAATIEQEVNGVDNMLYMSSTSSDGHYGLDVSFEVGTNVDIASVLVQNRVNIAEPKLPEDVRRLGVTTKKQSTALAGVIALYSPDASQSDLVLSNFVNTYWKDEIARLPGVGAINILPNKEWSMRVWLDPYKLKVRELTVDDVSNAIRQQNVQVAAGSIGRPPAPEGTDFEFIVNTKGRLKTPEEFGDIIVKTADEGRVVRVKDVARIELGSRDYSTVATFNGKPNAIMVVYQLPGANLVDITNNLRAALARLTDPKQSVPLPPGTQAKFFYDSSMFIRASLEEVAQTLLEAFILVFLVVLVFLQSLRTTLIPAVTIPVSLIGTALLLKLFGFSINMLTMFGMVLAIGIVVDDAIVVVENVERNMREHHLSPRDATIRAMGEITGPVIAITLVLMSVFLPTAALPGITGEMYRQFALTIAASTALSALNALTLSPALCALILKPHEEHPKKGFILFRPFSWFSRAFNWVFDRVTNAYTWLTRQSLRVAVVGLLLFGGVLFITFKAVERVPTGFVPNEDLGFVVVAASLPDGASLERTTDVMHRVSDIVSKVDGVQDVVTLSGFSVIQGQGTSFGNAWIVLKPWAERAKIGRGVDVIMNDIRGKVASIQESDMLVFSLPAIQGLGNTSGIEGRLEDKAGAGRDAMAGAAWDMIGAAMGQANANGKQRLLGGYTTFRAGVPQIFLDIDRDKVLKQGIPLQSVFNALQTQLGSTYVNDFNLQGRTYQVNLQADNKYRLNRQDITRLEVRNSEGQMGPIGAFTTVKDAIGPDRVERYNLYEAAAVYGIPALGTSSGEAMGLFEAAAADRLPPGMGFDWTALSFQEKRAGGKAILVFGLGMLLVYLILAAQYESWTTPLAVVLSVPLVVIGAMVALILTGLDNNVFTQIGLVLLIGLGAKNAILIVEFAREARAEGKSAAEAAITAARTRFRPILMTSFAFILGVTPLISASGAGAASRRALGTAVFGGMLGATVLGLLFTPVLYFVITRAVEIVRPPKPAPAAPAHA